MKNRIEIKKDKDSEDYYIDIYDMADLFEDVEVVESYKLEWKDDGSVLMEFFDKDGNKVFPKKA
jgi:hypothetical protein